MSYNYTVRIEVPPTLAECESFCASVIPEPAPEPIKL